MIKILHTSDWHLGKNVCGKSMIYDQKYFIDKFLINVINKEKPDVIIIAGDIFDKKFAPIDAIELFNRFITRLYKEFKINVVIISGNHDSPKRLSVASEVLRDSGVFISSCISDVYRPIEIKDGVNNVKIYTLPYFDLLDAKAMFKEANIQTYNDAYKVIINSKSKILKPSDFNILVTHCFVSGSEFSSDEEAICIGGSEEISSSIFSNFDYVALGHLHTTQKIEDNIRYSGSPLPYSFNDKTFNKSITIIESDKNIRKIRSIPITPLHNFKVIKGLFCDIICEAKKNPLDDYIYIILEDKAPIYMPMEQLRVYYPNLIMLSNDLILGVYEQNKVIKDFILGKESNDIVIFEDFLNNICGIEDCEGDLKVFEELNKLIKEE